MLSKLNPLHCLATEEEGTIPIVYLNECVELVSPALAVDRDVGGFHAREPKILIIIGP